MPGEFQMIVRSRRRKHWVFASVLNNPIKFPPEGGVVAFSGRRDRHLRTP
jgi:hypothetical protein